MTNYQAQLQIQLNNSTYEIELAKLEGGKCKANTMQYDTGTLFGHQL